MKKFFELATIDDDLSVLLDGKPLTSPAKNKLILPNAALAQAVADEWNAQGETIDKNALPLTGMASLAIDIAAPRRNELLVELLEYGETDLMFYHALDEDLSHTQRTQWQPWLNHAQVEFQSRYEVTNSILPIKQSPDNQAKHLQKLETLNAWQLALLAAVVKPTTSLLLSWFFVHHKIDAEKIYTLSHLEETHNAKKWGHDAEIKQKEKMILNDLKVSQHWRSLL